MQVVTKELSRLRHLDGGRFWIKPPTYKWLKRSLHRRERRACRQMLKAGDEPILRPQMMDAFLGI